MLDGIRGPRYLEQPGRVGVQVVQKRAARCERPDDGIACFEVELFGGLVHGCDRCWSSPWHSDAFVYKVMMEALAGAWVTGMTQGPGSSLTRDVAMMSTAIFGRCVVG